MKIRIAACALLAGLPGAIGMSPASVMAKAPLFDLTGLAIAGVRIGMTPAQVSSRLQAAGYVREFQGTNKSWEEKIARELASTRGVPLTGTFQAVLWHETYRKREERVEVYYQPMPSGPVVSGVDSLGYLRRLRQFPSLQVSRWAAARVAVPIRRSLNAPAAQLKC